MDDNEKGPQSEQKIWEKKKERQAQYSFVSEDKRRKQEEKSKKYDLILDDEIEFIQALKMPGNTFFNVIYYSRVWNRRNPLKTCSPLPKKFNIKIFNSFFLQFISKINKRTPTFIPDSRVVIFRSSIDIWDVLVEDFYWVFW